MHVKPNHRAAVEAGPTLIGFNWIGGREVEGDLPSFESRSSADSRDIIAVLPEAGGRDIERAIRTATEAQRPWWEAGSRVRQQVMSRLGELLKTHEPKLVRLMVREIGKPWDLCQQEIAQAVAVCERYAESAPPPLGVLHPAPRGVVGIMSSGAAPVLCVLDKLIPALAAGNTVVWKPAQDAAGIAYLLTRAFMDAGFPPGVINVVHGKGKTGCGKFFLAALEKGMFQGFCFTGSSLLGRHIAELCARHLIVPLLDLPAANPTLVMADADLDLATAYILDAAFAHAGQRVTRTANVLMHPKVAAPLQELLLARVAALPVGNPLTQPASVVGPLLSAKVAKAFEDHLSHAYHEGAVLLEGGARCVDASHDKSAHSPMSHGHFYPPTVLGHVTPESATYRAELLAPCLNLVKCDDFEKALSLANRVVNSRAHALFSRSHQELNRFAQVAHARLVLLNPAPAPLRPQPMEQDPFAWPRLIQASADSPTVAFESSHESTANKVAYEPTAWEKVAVP